MKKQVVLSQEEYQDLIKLAALATKLNDSYMYENLNTFEQHPADDSEANPTQRVIYSTILGLDENFRYDIREELGKEYFETPPGKCSVVLNDDILY